MKEQHLKKLYATMRFREGVLFRDFRKCFTHISVYEAKNELKNPGNSRFVFLGMFAFRGYLAELINTYISGNGKQLQQYLGNVFGNDRLATIFDELELENCISVHENVDYAKLKHVFAYALLGFIHQNGTDEFKQQIAFRYFLQDSGHLLPKSHRLNQIEILKTKASQVLDERIAFRHTSEILDDRALYNTQVVLSSGQIIGEHGSVSQTYAKKKAVKNALRFVLDKESETPEYQRFAEKQQLADEEKKSREKAERQKQHEAFVTQKSERRVRVKTEKKAIAREREFQRVLNKKDNKDRTGKTSKKASQSQLEEDMKHMNPSKRRRVQDKLK